MPRFENPVQLVSTYLEYAGSFVPDVAPAGKARSYYDQASALVLTSVNGGAYASAGTPSLATLTSYTIPFNPTASATAALLTLGTGTFTGGSASGQYLGIAHGAASFGGNWLVFRDTSAIRFAVAGSGAVTIGNAAGTSTILSSGAAAQLNVEKLVIANTGTTEISAIVNAPSGQTGDLEQWQVNASIKARITADGYLGIGTTAPGTTSAFRSLINGSTVTAIAFLENVTSLAGTGRAIRTAVYSAPAGTDVIAAFGISAQAFYRGSTSTTQSLIAAGDFNTAIDSTPATVTVTEAAAIRIGVTSSAGASGAGVVTFASAIGLMINNQGAGVGANLAVTNSYAIRVKAQSGAATQSYAIVSDGGECQITTGAVGTKGLTIAGIASQTADLLDVRSSAASLVSITAAGIIQGANLSIKSLTTTPVTIGTTSATATKSVLFSTGSGWGGTSGNQTHVEVSSNFNPASGTATFQALLITQTINQTGGASGLTELLKIASTETAISAGFHKLITATVGGTVRFAIGNDGRSYVTVPNSAPTDANLHASSVSMYLNEGGNLLTFRVKYADGTTLKTGTVALV